MLAFPSVETEQQSTSEALLRGLKVCLGLVGHEMSWTAGMSSNSLSLVLPKLVGILNHGNHTTDQRDSILRTTNRFVACAMPGGTANDSVQCLKIKSMLLWQDTI